MNEQGPFFIEVLKNNISEESKMKYLTLSADYNSFLKDDYDLSFSYKDLNIPLPLLERIFKWYETYSPIISMSDEERSNSISLINLLDSEGLELTEQLKEIVGEKAKIKYYSEGRLDYLTFL